MKAWQRMALAAALFAVVGLTGCQNKTAQNTQGNGPGNGPDGQGQFQQMQGTMGIVTDISDTSITIAVMPEGQGFGGQGRPSGSNRPSGSPRNSARPNQGQGPDESSRPTIDTSKWEKKTFTIDSSTKIAQMSRGNGNDSNQSATLKVSDLKSGESVIIAERSGKTGTADSITVMGRGGFGGQRGGGEQGNPGDGQNQGNPGDEAPSSTSKV